MSNKDEYKTPKILFICLNLFFVFLSLYVNCLFLRLLNCHFFLKLRLLVKPLGLVLLYGDFWWNMVFPCIQCRNKVRPRQHAVDCDWCGQWQHRQCGTGMLIKT